MVINGNSKFDELADIILEWNEKINVTAIRDRAEFMKKNVDDSLTILGRPEFSTALRILDLGTGGGFPGLPLAIAAPEKEFVLMDSVGKKLKVVADAAERLGLENVEVIHARAEDLARDQQYREAFDLVVSRAVANMSTLSEYCLPFVKRGGWFVAYKTAGAEDEIKAAEKAMHLLGGSFVEIVGNGTDEDDHVFVIVRKTGDTPSRYPRKAGLPSKQPL